MDFSFSAEEERFRERVRAFLKSSLPEGSGEEGFRRDKETSRLEFLRDWQRRLYEDGFVGMAWPREYGGQGSSQIEQAIFNEEMARFRAPPPLDRVGLSLVGPTLIAHGNEAQKKRFLPKILSAENLWCQLFSEPNAGSDLASLRTRAELRGDEFIVNGQKVWSSFAHYADWGILLARTDPAAPKHRGISYLLVDMKSPGINARPLHQMSGSSEFCEVFLDNVRIPRENLVGQINEGWRVATTTLSNERGTTTLAMMLRFQQTFDELVELARATRRSGRPATEDPIFRGQLAQCYVDLQKLKYAALRAFSSILKGGSPGNEGSILKLHWSEFHQRWQELALELEGPASQLIRESPYAVRDGLWQYTFLWSRSDTIYAGTSEIQRNIIAQRVLGLPKQA
ncbi:MAG TPA: acyl-CoA dehydrogenase [Candidatus Binataceae bacterium]|jgi:alkylation response protein AidB-like acyl-CoA dehydrogenase|nr:acyl-CoA dehydrogenase [Candidatus Binataceae bacterium]